MHHLKLNKKHQSNKQNVLCRSTLEEEVETLLKDIRFVQNCLDDEATFRAESVGTITREPTLSGKV